jgi:glycosyltransferase involved in cell wall biosynthesis
VTTISMLMPCFEPGPYLAPCLDSAVPQLGSGDELLVQDALSGDGSASLLDRVASRDDRIRVRHEADRGQSDALNRALSRATGDLVGWLNADDLLLPGALEAVRAACLAHGGPPDVVVGGWRVIASDAAILREKQAKRLDHSRLLRCGTYVFSGAVLVRREFLADLGGFRVDLHYTMDLDLMLRLASAAVQQVLLAAPLAAIRVHQTSKSAGPKGRIVRDGLAVRRRYSHGWRDGAAALAGTGFDLAAQATYWLRYTEGYSRLRRRVRW